MSTSATQRPLRTLRRLLDGWWGVRELAEAEGVDQKTIRRDLAAIKAAGFRLIPSTEPHNKKLYRALMG